MPIFDPAHPGELIRETIHGHREQIGEKLTIGVMASGLGTTRKTLSALNKGKPYIIPEIALKLGKALNNPVPLCLRVQENYDLAKASKKIDIRKICVFSNPVCKAS
jgi:antitoxin HigA-1